MSSGPMLELRDLAARVDSRTVLQECSVTVSAGEVVAVIGRNGAGKTVLFRTVAGFISSSAGQVFLEGKDISRLHPERRVAMGMAFVPQDRRIIGSLTVEDNLRLGAFRLASELYSEVLDANIELVPSLAALLRNPAATLSRGESTQLALARALMSKPKVLLVDEPFGGLSADAMATLANTLHALGRSGLSVLITEQDQTRATLAANRALTLVNGTISSTTSMSSPGLRLADG
jgi:ABC-type branched-subunit amino acid transport system ATPase component